MKTKDKEVRCPKCMLFYLQSYLNMDKDGLCRSCGVERSNDRRTKVGKEKARFISKCGHCSRNYHIGRNGECTQINLDLTTCKCKTLKKL